MALMEKQEYISGDANNIARVEDEGNIVSIEANLVSSAKEPSNNIIIIYRALCVILLKRKKRDPE